ncbi:hypothetical protein N665_0123s0010 [Sinapis alba]|nr:hypothetical protein N665_0123s0010 [Sinapis alba]
MLILVSKQVLIYLHTSSKPPKHQGFKKTDLRKMTLRTHRPTLDHCRSTIVTSINCHLIVSIDTHIRRKVYHFSLLKFYL